MLSPNFKHESLQREWARLPQINPALHAMIIFMLAVAQRFGKTPVLTSLFRPDAGSLHRLYRAADFRLRHFEAGALTTTEWLDTAQDVEAAFMYGRRWNGTIGSVMVFKLASEGWYSSRESPYHILPHVRNTLRARGAFDHHASTTNDHVHMQTKDAGKWQMPLIV